MDTPSTNSQNSSMNGKDVAAADDKKSVRPQPDHAEKCPRCDSGNTKFCYYNNYSLTQPRYFCKACRRYWTKGGTLRNVPVGGGCRKNKRSAKRALDNHHLLLVQNQQLENNNVLMSSSSFDPNITHGGLSLADHSNFSSPLRYEDPGTCDSLSLAFATLQRQSNVMQVHHPNHNLGFGYDYKYSVMAHQEPATINGNTLTSSTTPGFQTNFFEPQTLTSFNSNYLYNYGIHAQSDQTHTKPLLLDGNQNVSNMDSAEGFNMNGNKAFMGQENNELTLGGGSSLVKNNNNLAIGTNVSNNYNCNYNDVYSEVQGGRRSESWNNTGLAAASSWPSLINTAALIM